MALKLSPQMHNIVQVQLEDMEMFLNWFLIRNWERMFVAQEGKWSLLLATYQHSKVLLQNHIESWAGTQDAALLASLLGLRGSTFLYYSAYIHSHTCMQFLIT